MRAPVSVVALTLAVFAVSMLSMSPMAASAASQIGCFTFTENAHPIGTVHCNANANDIETVFKQLPGTPCFIQFTLNGGADGPPVVCPKGANDVDATWGVGSGGTNVITKCTWTHNGVPMTAPCPVPTTPPSNGFTFMGHIVTKVFWTVNGKIVKPGFKAPTGANDVEFSFK